jgi:hypothetical protein
VTDSLVRDVVGLGDDQPAQLRLPTDDLHVAVVKTFYNQQLQLGKVSESVQHRLVEWFRWLKLRISNAVEVVVAHSRLQELRDPPNLSDRVRIVDDRVIKNVLQGYERIVVMDRPPAWRIAAAACH